MGEKIFVGPIGAGGTAYIEKNMRKEEPEDKMNPMELRDKLIENFDIKGEEAKALRDDSQYWNAIDKEVVEVAVNGGHNDDKIYKRWQKESNREPLRSILYKAFKEYQE